MMEPVLALLLVSPTPTCPSGSGGSLIAAYEQVRTVEADAAAEDPSESESDSDSAQAPDFTPFVETVSATATVPLANAALEASQDSRILDAQIVCSGDAHGTAAASGTSSATGSAHSFVSVRFVLTTEASYTAQGFLNAFDRACGEASLSGQTPVFGYFAVGDFDVYTIDRSGILAPGQYWMTIEGNAGVLVDETLPSDLGRSEYDLTLSFTETRSEIGTRFCTPAAPNSTGAPGAMRVRGSVTAADDDLVLEARGLPPEPNIGYFLMGAGTNTFTPPGSAGPLCVAPGIRRFLPPIGNTAELPGGFTRSVGTSGPVSGVITAGSTWSFQAWHRDSMAGTSNTTDAVSVSFL